MLFGLLEVQAGEIATAKGTYWLKKEITFYM